MNDAGQDLQGKAADAYRILARKYRPRDFSALIGQEPMVRTLTNAFERGRIAQAWMLTGVRGVGKTTTARILARALNYKTADVDQPTISLDEPGEHCEAIMEGRHVDVIEMDAASHTGIDDIRDIIDRARYAPVSARYKVYIIDEVHMLSNQAFNGLLKTLEEPPPHVKFIFATTEIRKVPITVLSRCQRFDLRRVEAGLLTQHLKAIAEKEGVEVEDEAFAMIARAAEGSVRDSLSILDQAIAHSGATVSAGTVRDMLGLADRASVIDLFEHVMKGDVAAALDEFRRQYDAGADPATVLTDLAEFNHLVTRMRFVPAAADDASLSEDERRRGLEFSGGLSVRVLSRAWQMLLKGMGEVQSSNRPLAAGEMVLIRMAHAANLPTLDEALRTHDRAPPAPGEGPAPQSPGGDGGTRAATGGAATAESGAAACAASPGRGAPGAAQAVRLVESEARPRQEAEARAPEAEPEGAIALNSLADIAALADANRDLAFKVQLKNSVRLVRIEPGRLEVGLVEDAPKTLLNDISTRLKEWTGRQWFVTVSREKGGPTLAEEEAGRRRSAISDARTDPAVAAILERFPGARIIDVRIPDAAGSGETDAQPLPEPGIDGDDDETI